VSGLPLLSSKGIFEGVPYLTRSGQEGIIDMLGRAFTENRLITLFIITLPAIGLAERFGLQEQAAAVIRRVRAATVGRLQMVYQLFRVLTGILGLRLNGHAAFVRPLIYPMSIGAAEATTGVESEAELDDRLVERIKAANAAGENYGNFYGQNLSPVQAGIFFLFTPMSGIGVTPNLLWLVLFCISIASLLVFFGIFLFFVFDRPLPPKAAAQT